MLARINSGAGGVREYLETGRKKGREFERDLIDERFVLAGDIETTDLVIDSIQPTQLGASRYLHITLGFAERFSAASECGPGEVNLAKMEAVAEAYRELLMAAYSRDEYCWYAEAHVPKVSHDLHASIGEALERLPHVHIVLPMRNLVDGKHLNPAGYSKHNIQYEQAIQEVINQRFGLRSPLDAQRAAGTAPLARHNPAFAADSPKQLKQQLAERVAAGDIADFDQLIAAAGAHGEVRVRAGKDGHYVNVKPEWATKGINLKEFTREAFEAGTVGASQAKPDAQPQPSEFADVLHEWTSRVAFEARFLNSANRKHYQQLDAEEKTQWLGARVARAEALLRAELDLPPDQTIQLREIPDDRPDHERAAERIRLAAIAALQSDLDEDRRSRPPESFAGVRDLSSVPMAQDAEAVEELLHADSHVHVGREDGADHAVRRAGDGDSGATDRYGKRKLTFAQSLAKARSAEGPTPDQLKNDSSPTLVIEAAAQRFGLDRTKYDVTSGRDGTPRIRHEDKHYNLGDFFTKHLNVPWEDAKVILERCYYDTMADALPPPDKDLWKSFGAWRDEKFQASVQGRARIRSEVSEEILQARNKFKAIKISARSIAPKNRAAALALARAEQVTTIEKARAKAAQTREALAVPPRNAMYRAFLTEMANGGQLSALAELRRLAKPDPDMTSTVTGRTSRPVFPQPSYRVDYAGRVTYFQDKTAVVVDSAKGVSVIEATQNSYALALKVAVARYGTNLTFNGDAVFMKNMEKAARASGLRLTIRDAGRPSASPITVEPTIQR